MSKEALLTQGIKKTQLFKSIGERKSQFHEINRGIGEVFHFGNDSCMNLPELISNSSRNEKNTDCFHIAVSCCCISDAG